MLPAKPSILLIDADPLTCEAMEKALQGWDATVESVADPMEALSRSFAQAPDLAVCEISAPGAFELLDRIRSQARQVSILAIGPYARMDKLLDQFKEQINAFIPQPLNPDLLEITLKQLLSDMPRPAPSFGIPPDKRDPNAKNLMQTERLLTVKQLVDKLSWFIGQIANEVQGGVRYFNELPYFMAIHSREGRILATNPTFRKYLGHKPDRNSWEIYSGKLATRKACPVGRTIDTGSVMDTPAVVNYTNGAKVPVIVHTAPIYSNRGDIELILEIFAGSKDINRLGQEIKTTQQRYHQLFNAVPSHIAVLDRRLCITASNRRFSEAFGDQTPRRFFDVFRADSPSGTRCPIRATLEDGHPHQSEMILQTEDGSRHTMLAQTSPIKTAAGKLMQVLVIFTDVTELRQIQDNLSSLGLMLGTISHNLKGSLTGLDAGLYLIDKGFYRDRPGQIEEGLDIARQMVERIRRMVRDVLYYSKERELDTARIEVAQLVRDTRTGIEARIRAADIAFICDCSSDLGHFEIDASLMRTALGNILENAMEACLEDTSKPTHQIKFTVSTDNGRVVFRIEDNGVGIPADQIENIFNLFYSAKGSKGTGLGLFITHTVIQKHGGKISVDSQPGKGARFKIEMPRTSPAITLSP
jgi:PAS domain S-box-containing protein